MLSRKSAAAKEKRESKTGIRVEMYGCDAVFTALVGFSIFGREDAAGSCVDLHVGTGARKLTYCATSGFLAFCCFCRFASDEGGCRHVGYRIVVIVECGMAESGGDSLPISFFD